MAELCKTELEKIKAEISYKTACKKCTDCGLCDQLLKQAIDERQVAQSEPRGCASCRL